MAFQQYSPGGIRMLPPAVKNILIINVILFIATYVFENVFRMNLLDLLGLHFPSASKFEPYQIITYMFMHGSLGHIFFNMLALWMFGAVLENYWGTKKFLIYYFVTGIGAAATHYLVRYFVDMRPMLLQINVFLDNPTTSGFQNLYESQSFGDIFGSELKENARQLLSLWQYFPDKGQFNAVDFVVQLKAAFLNSQPVVGASGSVFGLLLAFGMLFPNAIIYLYFAIPVKAKWLVIIYGALELYAGIWQSGSNVAHFAHLGGMIFGFLLILYWRKRTRYFNEPGF